MLREIVRFEWRYHTRQAAFLATSLFFLLFGFTLTATGFGPENVALNAPFLVTESLAFLSIFSVFAVAIFGSNAVVRDVEYRMQEIMYSTPVGRFHYVFGRFAGCFLAALTSASFGAIGMAVATYMPWQSAERIASFDVRAYLWPLLVVVLPNVLVATALLFAIATLTRSSLATYAGAVFIYVLYFVGAALTNSPLMAASKPGATSGAWASLLDPFALSSFFEQTRYWSVAEKNTRFVALVGSFLLNRVVWVAFAGAVWLVVYRTFSFRTAATKPSLSDPSAAPERGTVAAPTPTRSSTPYIAAARLDMAALFKSIPFLLLLLLWMVLAGAEAHSEIFSGEYGSASYPATSLIVAALKPPLFIIGMIAILYYGSEVFWRERRYRMSAIIETTPIPSWSMIAAKWTALVAMIAALVASGIVAGVVIQLLHGYHDFEPLVYLSLFDFAGWPLALLAA
ncbi:MAG TPA: ABC transporter permease, partial [Thermoanaerobaculia bacterium]|nr:ABC transporter permease [Thermoanaerobaculia bacterium]